MASLSGPAREHARLQELIAGFTDGELSWHQDRAVQEHLRDCARCGRELALQQGVSRALALEAMPQASATMRQRIEQLRPISRRRPAYWSGRWAAGAAAALALIAVAGEVVLGGHRGQAARPIAEIPMLRDALADCRRAMARNFPRKADLQAVAEGLDFQVRALDTADVELFSTWKTTIAGSPAAGLAYRWRGIVVVQYVVPHEVLELQPDVSEALRAAGFYAASELGQGVLAILANGSGTVLVADAPPEQLRRLIL